MALAIALVVLGLFCFAMWRASCPANPNGLRSASRIMAWVATAAAAWVLATAAISYLYAGARTLPFGFTIAFGTRIPEDVPFALRAAAFGIELIPLGLLAWALWSLRRLFFSYARGEVFSPYALKQLNHVATALLLSVAADFVMQAPTSLLLSWANGPGQREISIGLSSPDLAKWFVAGVALVITRVMREARRVADENASFV